MRIKDPQILNKQSFQDLGSSILGLSILDPDGKSHFYRVEDTGWTVMEAETQEIMCPQAQRYYTKVGQCSTFKKKSGYAAL